MKDRVCDFVLALVVRHISVTILRVSRDRGQMLRKYNDFTRIIRTPGFILDRSDSPLSEGHIDNFSRKLLQEVLKSFPRILSSIV
jgi:hypothetical protein